MKTLLLASLLLTSQAFASTLRELHNQDLVQYKDEMKQAIPADSRLCAITGIKDQFMDSHALIDLSSFAKVYHGQKTVSVFYVYRGESSNPALPQDELTKVIVIEGANKVESTKVEVYEFNNSAFHRDLNAGKIDFPGYVLAKTFSCHEAF
jgi:hypothetical protein